MVKEKRKEILNKKGNGRVANINTVIRTPIENPFSKTASDKFRKTWDGIFIIQEDKNCVMNSKRRTCNKTVRKESMRSVTVLTKDSVNFQNEKVIVDHREDSAKVVAVKDEREHTA